MRNLSIFRSLVLAGACAFLTTCQSEPGGLEPQPLLRASSVASTATDEPLKLGKQLNNPYSVSNMQEAASKLSSEYQSSFDVRPTHLYVRFAPRNIEEYDALTDDSTLVLSNHPLDYEVFGTDGGTYHDPTLPQEQPTYQYAAVLYPYSPAKDVPYQVLDKLYLPEQDPLLASANAPTDIQKRIDALVDVAEALSGNYDAARVTNYHAQGKLRVFDTRFNGLIPLPGVKVRVRRWFTYEDDVTDENGDYYITRSFARDVNYAIFYERNDFDIRSGLFGQAWYNGPKQSSPWNLDIAGGVHRFYAHINRAASDYYYRNRINIKSPPTNSFWRAAVKIAAYDESNQSSTAVGEHCKDCRLFGILPRINIYSKDANRDRYSDEIYSTTIHELAHASHWEFRRNVWTSTETRLKESWALGVAWAFTRVRYFSYGDLPNRTDNYQNRRVNTQPDYTPIAIDLYDNDNQGNSCFGTGCINDPAYGFTFVEMEDALHGANGFTQWRDNLIAQPGHSPFEPQLRVLFSNYP